MNRAGDSAIFLKAAGLWLRCFLSWAIATASLKGHGFSRAARTNRAPALAAEGSL